MITNFVISTFGSISLKKDCSAATKLLVMLGFFCLLSGTTARAQSNQSLFRCNNQKHIVNLSLNNSGESVEGPVCAQITVNALRYMADFGKTVTYTGGANLTGIFPSSFSPGGKLGAEAAPADLDDQFNADSKDIDQLQSQLILLESTNRSTAASVDKYLSTLKAMIVQSDELLATGGPAGVLAVVNAPETKKDMDAMLNSVGSWKTTDEIVTKLQKIQADLNSLPFRFATNTGAVTGETCSDANIKKLGWSDWSTKCRDGQYKQAQSSVAAMLTDANQWTSDGDKASQFAKKIGVIQYWKDTIASLSDASFTRQTEVRCGVLFNRNEQTVLKLIVADRTSVFDGQTPQPQTKDGLLTITCASPFSISAGVAFNTTENKQFAIVKSAPPSGGTSSVNTFGVTSDSRVNPYPIAMAHVRLYDWRDNRYGLHYSFGVGANIKGQDSGGSNPEFLTGLSFSFLRTIFITGGLDIGKQSELIGGFKVGDTAPPDITSPPVSSSYKPGFGFAVTFTKP